MVEAEKRTPQDGQGSTPLRHTLLGRCPRCGEGLLFERLIALRPACSACGLDFRPFEQADGPAVFSTMIVGFLILGGALALEVAAHPPVWVQAVLWLPLVVAGSFASLRLTKAWLVAEQFRHGVDNG